MAEANLSEAPGLVPPQHEDAALQAFHEYRWDLDKDFLVSLGTLT